MKIEQTELNEWAHLARQTNGKINRACFLLSQLVAPPPGVEAALAAVTEAQGLNSRLHQAIRRAGADDPAPREGLPTRRDSPSLEQMTSPANRRLAQLLRETAQAAADVEAERGQDGGLSEILTGYAEQTETECYGPAGLEER